MAQGMLQGVPAANLALPAPAAHLAPSAVAEPKGALNHFCQRYCKRPVTKADIVYTSAKYGKVFQVTVTLNCMEGQQFVGETAMTLKEAEKNAAYQALVHFEPLNDTLPPVASKNKKRKATSAPAMPALVHAPLLPPQVDTGSTVMAAVATEEPALKALKTMTGAPDPISALGGVANPALTCKVVLNTVCMKLLKRPMQKGEVVYETHQTPIGYQSTVRLPCLPGEWGELAWAGEVAQQQKHAEQNAAKEALEAVNQNAETIRSQLPLQQRQMAPAAGAPAAGGACSKGQITMMQIQHGLLGGKSKGKGKGKFFNWKGSPSPGAGAGFAPAEDVQEAPEEAQAEAQDEAFLDEDGGSADAGFVPGIPVPPVPARSALHRFRVTEVAITGEITEWKGKYGWLRPHADIGHPMAAKRGGKVFMSTKDVIGTVDLCVGTMVQFHIYEDATGLGAEEVTAF